MTGEEKRKKLKEQYKQDLEMRKEFLGKVQKLRKLNRINHALSEMKSAISDDSDDWIDKLNQDTALTEAKLDLSLDLAEAEDKRLEDIAKEAEMERISAEQLVLEMKRELGLLPEEQEEIETAQSQESETKEQDIPADNQTETGEDLSNSKTLGDF